MEYFLDKKQKEFIVTNIEKANQDLNKKRKLSSINTTILAIESAAFVTSIIAANDVNIGHLLIGLGGSLNLIALSISILESIKLNDKINDLKQILMIDKLNRGNLYTQEAIHEDKEGMHR